MTTTGESWNLAHRSETPTQRLDRNWSCLLQELRVVLTGVQLLTGFLLTLPFQQRFSELDGTMHWLYLSTVACSVAATAMLTAPVALHRFVFRRHMLLWLVGVSHRLTLIGLLLLGAAVSGVITMIFDVMVGRTPSSIAGSATMATWIALWVALPLLARRGTHADAM